MTILEYLSDKSKVATLSSSLRAFYANARISVSVHSLGVMPPICFVLPVINEKNEAYRGLIDACRYYIELYQHSESIEYTPYFSAHLLIHNPNMSRYTMAWQCLSYPAANAKGLIAENTVRLSGILFQQGNYVVAHQNKAVSKLFTQPRFLGKDLISFLEMSLVPLMRDDANGYLAIVPIQPLRPEYKVIYLPSYALTHKVGNFYRFELEGDGKYIEYLFDENNTQITGFADVKHGLGYPTLIQLGGISVERNKGISYYESFWSKAISNIDNYVRLRLDANIIESRHTHPIAQVIEIPCEVCDATGIVKFDEQGKPCAAKTCHSCDGSKVVKIDHSRAISIPMNTLRNADGAVTNMDFIKYYKPETAAKDSAIDAAMRVYELCKEDLNLLFVDAAQSGTAKAIDREERNSVIAQIRNRVFDVVRFLADTIAAVSFGVAPATIIQPSKSLELINAKKLADEYLALKNSGADSLMVEMARKKWLSHAASDDPVLVKINKLLEIAAPLRDYSTQDLLSLLGTETVKKEDAIASIYAYSAINEYIQEKGDAMFLAATNKELILYIDEYIDKKTPSDPLQTFDSLDDEIDDNGEV